MVASISFPGFMKFSEDLAQSINFNNLSFHTSNRFGYAPSFKDVQLIDQKVFISGNFSTTTVKSAINQNIRLVKCDRPGVLNWYGEGLMVYHNKNFYPILDSGKVVNFLQLKDEVYILKDNGQLYFTELDHINKEINQLKKTTTTQE